MYNISKAEKQFIRLGIEDDIRNDGRSRMDYRDFSVETGILPQSNGSSIVQLGDTKIICSVKLEIGSPDPNIPNWGKVFCSVEWCKSLSNSSRERIDQEKYTATLSRRLERALIPAPNSNIGGIDLKSLCIISGRQCWYVYIDIMVMGNGGNLIDAISLGTRAGLRNAKIPKTNIIPGEFDGEMDFELSDDPLDCERFNIENIPICVSLTKIGNYFIIDPSIEEEQCMSMQLTVAIDKQGNFCSMSKSGTGAINPSGMIEMLQSVKKIGQSLLQKIDSVLSEEETKEIKSLGFFGL